MKCKIHFVNILQDAPRFGLPPQQFRHPEQCEHERLRVEQFAFLSLKRERFILGLHQFHPEP